MTSKLKPSETISKKYLLNDWSVKNSILILTGRSIKKMSPRTKEQNEIIRTGRREEILDAAIHLFAEEGYHNSSVSRIAQKAGISKGLMYNYFESKEDVLRAIIQGLFDHVMSDFHWDEIDAINDETFEKWIDYSLDVVLKDHKKWKLYASLSMQPDVTPIFMEAASGPLNEFNGKLLQYFKSKGVLDPEFWIRHLSAQLDGIQMHIMLDPENYPLEKSRNALKYQLKQLLK